MEPLPKHPRELTAEDAGRVVYVVWELTMRCDHACAHCGSRAAKPRSNELSLDESLDVADQLVRLGVREVTLIGGEAYLYPGFEAVVERLAGSGLRVSLQTGGRGVTPKRAQSLASAGVRAVGFSVDGTAEVHDELRASRGSHAAALRGMEASRLAGMTVTANSQINRLSMRVLPETAQQLKDAGAAIWRAHLTVPMGRAAERPDWILEPYMVPQVIDALAELQVHYAEQAQAEGLPVEQVFNITLGNNLGYYGPHEVLLRSHPGRKAVQWAGCNAGTFQIGIESNGNIKACPSLPSAPYVGGNVRDLTIEQIFHESPELNFVNTRTLDELWGFCKTCAFAERCRAGCSFTAHTTLGKRGNNPFCTHRATTLAASGRRERLVQVQAAPGLPYDFGRFELVEEDLPVVDVG